MRRRVFFAALAVVASAACGSADPVATQAAPVAPETACKHKAAWPSALGCLRCSSSVVQAPCECSPGPANGTCFELNKRRGATCATSVNDCVLACATDCACLGRCYDGQAACAAASADLEGCILQTCDPSCR